MPPSPGACKLSAQVDRTALPRWPDGRVWLPPGGEGMADAELVAALAAAWGTPAWVLGLAGQVLRDMALVPGGVERWIGGDAAWRPGTAVETFRAPLSLVAADGGLELPRWVPATGDAARLPWWCNCPWRDGKRWAARALAEHRAGRAGAYLAPVSNGGWHALLGAEAAAVLDISPLAFEPCSGLVGFKVTACPYGVRIYILPGEARPRVRPAVYRGLNPSGADCVLYAGPRASLSYAGT